MNKVSKQISSGRGGAGGGGGGGGMGEREGDVVCRIRGKLPLATLARQIRLGPAPSVLLEEAGGN